MSEKTDPRPSIQLREFYRKKKELQGLQGRPGDSVELQQKPPPLFMLKGQKRRGCLEAIRQDLEPL